MAKIFFKVNESVAMMHRKHFENKPNTSEQKSNKPLKAHGLFHHKNFPNELSKLLGEIKNLLIMSSKVPYLQAAPDGAPEKGSYFGANHDYVIELTLNNYKILKSTTKHLEQYLADLKDQDKIANFKNALKPAIDAHNRDNAFFPHIESFIKERVEDSPQRFEPLIHELREKFDSYEAFLLQQIKGHEMIEVLRPQLTNPEANKGQVPSLQTLALKQFVDEIQNLHSFVVQQEGVKKSNWRNHGS